MMITWTPKTVQWMTDASYYTGYHEKMAQILLQNIPSRNSLCDMGCGLGLVDLVLASHIRQIVCVDISDYAIRSLQERSAQMNISNLTCRCCDGAQIVGQFETVTALFHSSLEKCCGKYLSLATDRLLFVTHADSHGQTGPEGYRLRKCDDIAAAESWLRSHAISYTLETAALEFGQPHHSLEDALDFHRVYSKNAPEEALRRHVLDTVRETGRSDFPLYTPKQRSFGVFVIRRADNPAFLQQAGG